MIFFIFDFETTGLLPETHSICEVGVALWDTVAQRIIRVADYLVWEPNMVWEQAAIEKHGITPELCEKYGMPSEKAFRQFTSWANSADVFVAFNGKAFDFPMWDAWAAKHNAKVPEKLRFDPIVDIMWPKDWKSRELFYIAAKHGILNHFIHSGAGDVLTLIEIIRRHTSSRGCECINTICELGTVLEYAKMPEIWIEGVCSIDDRERVKTNGYHWWPWPQDSANKKWIKKIKEGLLDQEIATGKTVGYGVRRLS
jgi:DNA polymerase III alpha subunit (gram-positive type)